jgi:hypothetical protein
MGFKAPAPNLLSHKASLLRHLKAAGEALAAIGTDTPFNAPTTEALSVQVRAIHDHAKRTI